MAHRPPRLPSTCYLGRQRYFVTANCWRGAPHFASEAAARTALTLLLRRAAARDFAVIAYCVMPNHVHLLAEGTSDTSDLMVLVSGWKQQVAFALRDLPGARIWQDSFFDRVLRQHEDALGVAAYIVANPVRAGLVDCVTDYPFAGSGVYSMEQLVEAVQVSARWSRRA